MNLPIPPEIRRSVELSAEQAYRQVEADPEWPYGKDIAYRVPVCGWISSLMQRQLTASGYSVEQEIRREGEINSHAYLLIEPESLEIVSDATWQQFLPAEARSPELPKVLMGDREDMIEEARRYGVMEKWLYLWEPRSTKWSWNATRNT